MIWWKLQIFTYSCVECHLHIVDTWITCHINHVWIDFTHSSFLSSANKYVTDTRNNGQWFYPFLFWFAFTIRFYTYTPWYIVQRRCLIDVNVVKWRLQKKLEISHMYKMQFLIHTYCSISTAIHLYLWKWTHVELLVWKELTAELAPHNCAPGIPPTATHVEYAPWPGKISTYWNRNKLRIILYSHKKIAYVKNPVRSWSNESINLNKRVCNH